MINALKERTNCLTCPGLTIISIGTGFAPNSVFLLWCSIFLVSSIIFGSDKELTRHENFDPGGRDLAIGKHDINLVLVGLQEGVLICPHLEDQKRRVLMKKSWGAAMWGEESIPREMHDHAGARLVTGEDEFHAVARTSAIFCIRASDRGS